VDELGTKAGAVTKVEMKCGSVMDAKIVRLDRPFVYAIIDNASKLPMFIGTVIEIAD
jgi:serpin B